MSFDDMFEEFMIYNEFIASDVTCPHCGQVYELLVDDLNEDARYQCDSCHGIFLVNWVDRTVRAIHE